MEATCRGSGTAGAGEGRLLLETDELIFRGPARCRIPLNAIRRVAAEGGRLVVDYPDGSMQFELGGAASTWAERIRSPKSRLEKLGIKSGDRVAVIGVRDPGFDAELATIDAKVSRGRVPRDCPTIVFGASSLADLERLETLKAKMARDGGIWVVHRKGPAGVKDVEIFAAGKRAGLTATKVARFSETHTAERLVIPKSLR